MMAGRPQAGSIERRFLNTWEAASSSYDAEFHSCECIISVGAPVTRFYGTEILEISEAAVNLDRLPVPLLDSHSQATISDVLGRIEECWISGGQLHGRIVFAQTERGTLAESMVSRGELTGISAGYRVEEWSAADADGDPVDPARAGWEDDLTFTATRWELLEVSLVGVPADAVAGIRSFGSSDLTDVATIRARMWTRQRMHDRAQAMLGDTDD
jgi:phage head maturation protease